MRNIDLPEQLFISLTQGHLAVKKWASSVLVTTGITLSEYHLLRIVQNEKRVVAKCIREKLNTTAPSITQLITKLEQRNLISRTQLSTDKRMQYITLTEEGKKVVKHARISIKNATEALSLSATDYVRTIESLADISKAITSHSALLL